MDSKRLREVAIMSKQLDGSSQKSARYQQINVIEHLASQFVLGTLTKRVYQRILTLAKHNVLLEQRIDYWQEKFVCIDESTIELPPSEQTWSVITTAINVEKDDDKTTLSTKTTKTTKATKKSVFAPLLAWFAKPYVSYSMAFSVIVLCISTFMMLYPLSDKIGPLSYVAVLTEKNGQAHMVASTYGDSKKLVVNIINRPNITVGQDLELWVISKTDGEARSFGIIPNNETLIEQQLTQAQWRLIKDSKSLIVTMEEAGGSAMGEPSDLIVSRGLCVRLQEWQKNA